MRKMFALAALALSVIPLASTQAAWNVATSPHFVIYSEQDPPALRAYAEKLERFDGAMRAISPPPADHPPVARVTIYVMPDAASLHDLVGRRDIQGIYRGDMTRVYAFTIGASPKAKKDDAADALTVLLHEYAHHFMRGNFAASYPPWFTEGYAEFMSAARFEANGNVSLGVPENNRGTELQELWLIPLQDMMAGAYYVSADLEAKGWVLTHYLTFEPSRAGQLPAFLDAMIRGEPPMAAAQRIFGDLRTLDRELAAYVKRPKLSYMTVAAARIAPEPITISSLSPTESALMPARMKTTYGVDKPGAKRIAGDIRHVLAQHPDDLDALCLLARAEYWTGRNDAIEAAADQMLAHDPSLECGNLFKGYALLQRAREAKLPVDDKTWGEARRALSRANRAAPEDPWPMGLFYYSFLWAHAKPTANAVEALFGALDRAPNDRGLRYRAVIEMLRAGRADAAHTLAAPLVGEALGKAYRLDEARKLYDRIGHDDPATVADALEAKLKD